MSRRCRLALFVTVALSLPAVALAADWRVDPEQSTFAVLTQREGLASGLAHDHLIIARTPDCRFSVDAASPENSSLRCRQEVAALDVDPAAERARLAGRLQQLGALSRDLPPLSDGDRADIRAAMLSADQLDAERFPRIEAELLGITPRKARDDLPGKFEWTARLRMDIHGRSLETTAPLRAELNSDELRAELLVAMRFSDFGIEPYSALLGAVRNADRFYLYVELVAHPAQGKESASGK